MLTIRRFVSTRFVSTLWLAVTPLVILSAIVGVFALIGPASWIISTLAGPQAADNFVANVMTLFGMLVLFAPLAMMIYALVSLVRWLVPKQR
ncbi:hypothetical protein [Bradyrhizobium iriomotense]|uniref:Uncharacterized protein n=1 Tax=Bradyrhizobium iriomotense TaxID=441950 RepID=A0ABQ6B7U5_9BRAD|nr:hypothetical protein [Bradyrhizobium iriomotense]GLR90447.1 hypothetical protein GCM10007857_71620 [Bradyrhizobium iriomotense]